MRHRHGPEQGCSSPWVKSGAFARLTFPELFGWCKAPRASFWIGQKESAAPPCMGGDKKESAARPCMSDDEKVSAAPACMGCDEKGVGCASMYGR
eukprot:300571-Chlamydomonas_euryale.AAC.11